MTKHFMTKGARAKRRLIEFPLLLLAPPTKAARTHISLRVEVKIFHAYNNTTVAAIFQASMQQKCRAARGTNTRFFIRIAKATGDPKKRRALVLLAPA